MSKKKLNKAWLKRHLDDPFVKLAQREGFRARAAYKLQEIDQKEHLIKPGMAIVDLGAAPGSWCQYIVKKLHINTLESTGDNVTQLNHPDNLTKPTVIIALDLLPMDPVSGVHFILGDFREEDCEKQLLATLASYGKSQADLVISDMAPNLSGIEAADSARMAYLHELALDFALKNLTLEGKLLVKAFQGSGFSQTIELFKKHFKRVVIKKPAASRSESSEVFVLCSHRK